ENPDHGLLLDAMRTGIREFLYPPFERHVVREALARVAQVLARAAPPPAAAGAVFAFLPAKAGVGTSTIALNVAAALAEQAGFRVLLGDFDLGSGLLDFMLKLEPHHSVTHAAEHAADLDESLWPQLVTSAGRMDLLASGRMNPGFRIEPAQVRYILDFARRNYRAICLDLSGNMEKYSIEAMHEAKRVFLVCTSEVPALHLAREKLNLLRKMELEERVGILLNRAQKRAVVSLEEIENLLGARVEFAFPNDYPGVHKALTAGTPVDPASELGRRFRDMARQLFPPKDSPPAPKRRFVEYFSLLPARYSLLQPGKKH
ncbi:MAG: CpaE family protein, partial [Bryobacteraceae bacterium]